MTNNTTNALQALLDALVSRECPNAELPALFANTAGAGDIVPAIIKARAALAANAASSRFIVRRDADGCAYLARVK